MQPNTGERGSAAVEFALVCVLFITLLLGIFGFGHWVLTLEMLTDATRTGARMAVVCDLNDADIRTAVSQRVPLISLTNAEISLQYFPAGCTRATCQSITVSITGARYASSILPAAMPIPPFTTTLPRESLESTSGSGDPNPVCS